MKKTLCLVALLISAFTITAGNENDYEEYCKQLKQNLNLTLLAPDGTLKINNNTSSRVLTFGDVLESTSIHPIFVFASLLTLNENCSVVMPDVSAINKPKSGDYSPKRIYNTPSVTGWMLDNCGFSWKVWRESIATGELDLHEDIILLRNRYECRIEDCKLTEKSNCDRIFVVRIPNMDKVSIDIYTELQRPQIEMDLKTNATECYGVEFYKHSSYEPLKMLFFINGNNTTIDECVAKMAEYVTFE